MAPRKNATRTRGRPFKSGNPGRPKGSRNKATQAAELLLDGEAEGLARKAIELALDGDMAALKLCLERLVPVRKNRPVQMALPDIKSVDDIQSAMHSIVRSVGAGEITPNDAQIISNILEQTRRAHEVVDIDARLTALEESK